MTNLGFYIYVTVTFDILNIKNPFSEAFKRRKKLRILVEFLCTNVIIEFRLCDESL